MALGLGAMVVLAALVSGSPAFAEAADGAMIVWLSIIAAADVTRRFATDQDTGRELIWDLMLIFIVLAGLIGVGLVARGLG